MEAIINDTTRKLATIVALDVAGYSARTEAAIARYRQVSSIDMRERLSLFRNPAHRKLFRDGIDLAEGKPAAP